MFTNHANFQAVIGLFADSRWIKRANLNRPSLRAVRSGLQEETLFLEDVRMLFYLSLSSRRDWMKDSSKEPSNTTSSTISIALNVFFFCIFPSSRVHPHISINCLQGL